MAMTSAVARPGRIGLTIAPGAFRLLLAFAVVVSHISRADIGGLAVAAFFYLSGYWVLRVYQEKFGPGSVLKFYAARYLRIAPLAAVAAIGAAILLGQAIYPESFTLIGIGTSQRDPTGVAWSLDVELQFYLLIPVVALAAVRLKAWTLAAITGALCAIGYWLKADHGVVTVALYLPAFLLGALTYAKAWKPSERSANLSLAAFGLVTALVFVLTPFGDKTAADWFDYGLASQLWILPLLPYIAHSLGQRSDSLDRHLGNLSFPLYLVHCAIITFAMEQFGVGLEVRLLAVVVAMGAALIAYAAFDRPLDRLRVRLTER